MAKSTIRYTQIFVLALGIAFVAGCSTSGKKPVDSFSNGYDKITVASRDGGANSENEVIRPEYITEIKKNASNVTAVQTIALKNGKQDSLLESLINNLRRTSGKIPGLVSFNVLKGVNGKSVLNYMQFEDKKAYNAWVASAQHRDYVEAIRPYAATTDTGVYEVVFIQQ